MKNTSRQYTVSHIDAEGWIPYVRPGRSGGEEIVIHLPHHDGPGLRAMMWRTGPIRVDYFFAEDEFVIALRGSVTITLDDGSEVRLSEGDVAAFEKGAHSTWQVDESFMKIGVLATHSKLA